jgi:uncharacterized SAM-dependent methyltransferase
LNLPLNISALSLQLPPASPQFIALYRPDSDGQAVHATTQELTDGLLAAAAHVSPKFFYNELGSKLFEAITGLDEYYPTRTEAGIFEAAHGTSRTRWRSAGITRPCLIDLGAGNCAKAMTLIPHLQPRQYVPVDISVDFLRDAAEQVQNSFPALDIVGLGMDFSAGLVLPDEVQAMTACFSTPAPAWATSTPRRPCSSCNTSPTRRRARRAACCWA